MVQCEYGRYCDRFDMSSLLTRSETTLKRGDVDGSAASSKSVKLMVLLMMGTVPPRGTEWEQGIDHAQQPVQWQMGG